MYDILYYIMIGAGALFGVALAGAHALLLLAVVARGLGLMSDSDMDWLSENM